VSDLLHQLIENAASDANTSNSPALQYKNETLTYSQLCERVKHLAHAFICLELTRQARVAIYLPKQIETVISFFATTMAGKVIVPVNPVLKSAQVKHILQDCNAQVLITTRNRLKSLGSDLADCPELSHVITLEEDTDDSLFQQMHFNVMSLSALLNNSTPSPAAETIDTDMAAILYTSGSTGKPKGVVLSHLNMVAGAKSVSQYLRNTSQDRLLAVLPFSFDYGFSQLTTAFHVGACVVIMEYLLPRDVIRAVSRFKISGLAAVPPLWNQLAQLEWPQEAIDSLRYITNSGGAMPQATLDALMNSLPETEPYLMYGLTEAFRSTYLSPQEISGRPDSMGKAIPNAEILVVRNDGSLCAPDEPGELVHRGSLVAMGYWNDPEKTAERFKPVPIQHDGLPLTEIAVWSGDIVRTDEEGYLYFISRKDEMIKSSGYRISPTEIEEVVYQSGLVSEVVALGIPHPMLGQAILCIVTKPKNSTFDKDELTLYCKQQFPSYMMPAEFVEKNTLPRNPNGKIDRKLLAQDYNELYQDNT